MSLSPKRKERLKNKIEESRSRIMEENLAMGLMLMYLRYVATDSVKRVSTDGKAVFFSADYFDKLNADEMDFVLCHLLIHIALGDIWKVSTTQDETFHHACDFKVNTYLHELGFEKENYSHIGKIYKLDLSVDSVEKVAEDEIIAGLIYRISMFDKRTQVRMLMYGKEASNRKQ